MSMFLVAAAKVTGTATWLLAAVLSAVDSEWATPLNTLLLLITLVAGAFLNKKVSRVESKTDRNHESATHAAAASASAAEAAATSARITKELGGQLREVRLPITTDATDTTEPGGGGV